MAISFYLDALNLALQSIFGHKLRTCLTLLGMIIGVASVVVVGASIEGLHSYVLERASKMLGLNHFVMARVAEMGRISQQEYEEAERRNKALEWDDLDFLIGHCASCTAVGASSSTQLDLKRETEELFDTEIIGVTANMGVIEDKSLADGRFIQEFEVDRAIAVVVLGADAADTLFPDQDPIGKALKIRGYPFTVVGVESRRGSMFGQSMDRHVYIPLSEFEKLFGRRHGLDLHGKANDREQFERALEEARVAMRVRRKLKAGEADNFDIVNMADVGNEVDEITDGITAVAIPITLISLVVGGIVIMNIMLVSVTERTFEIGLRKALGAKRSQILLQFLIESALLAALGGTLGLALAVAVSTAIGLATPIPMNVTMDYAIFSIGFSGGIGVLAGYYPARRASLLDPVVALARVA